MFTVFGKSRPYWLNRITHNSRSSVSLNPEKNSEFKHGKVKKTAPKIPHSFGPNEKPQRLPAQLQ